MRLGPPSTRRVYGPRTAATRVVSLGRRVRGVDRTSESLGSLLASSGRHCAGGLSVDGRTGRIRTTAGSHLFAFYGIRLSISQSSQLEYLVPTRSGVDHGRVSQLWLGAWRDRLVVQPDRLHEATQQPGPSLNRTQARRRSGPLRSGQSLKSGMPSPP